MKNLHILACLVIALLLASCNDDDNTSAPQPEPLVTVDPEIERSLNQQFPLGFKYSLQNNQVTFIKVFDSYTNEAIEADFLVEKKLMLWRKSLLISFLLISGKKFLFYI